MKFKSSIEVLQALAFVLLFSSISISAMADDEPPWQGEPIGALPPLPWIDCKSLVDSWQETKSTKEERLALQKCFGGGGVPPHTGKRKSRWSG